MVTTAVPLICPQGHGPGNPGSRFCTWCGIALVIPAVPAQSSPPAYVTPPAVPIAPPVTATSEPSAFVPFSAATEPQTTAVAPDPWTKTQTTVPVAPVPGGSVLQTPVTNPLPVCDVCGGNGIHLNSSDDVCPGCGYLRPLLSDYKLDRSVFLWAQDGQAMTKLQKIPALHSVVRSVSDKVGRPWIESTFNGIRLGPRQLPDVWKRAVLAARILGLSTMPDVYVAGDQMWNTYTFGSDTSAFIVLGTAILTNFQNDELLFVLAREMGHCRAGHALWKTVTRFIAGSSNMHGLLSNGLLNALHPVELIQGAVEMPLMAWQRHSEITADRAGLLAVGDEALARRVLLAWSIRSSRLLKQINIEEWMKQEDASDDKMTRLSEMTTSSSMYTTRRLRLIGQAAHERELMSWSQSVQSVRRQLDIPKHPAQAPSARGPVSQPAPQDSIRVVCTKCQTPMRVPFAVLRGKSSLNVRCPKCQIVTTLRPKAAKLTVPDGGRTESGSPEASAAANEQIG